MNKLRTLSLLESIRTHGHGPLKFLCEDFNIYYAKYQPGKNTKLHDIDSLFSEVVCSMLLKHLKVPTPDLAILEIAEGSYLSSELRDHEELCKPGELYLGSKKIYNSDLMQSLNPTNSKEISFNEHIYDLLKIAIFDLWVNNCDRGRSGNYNILIEYGTTGHIYYAFDHGYCFGGLTLFTNGKLQLFNANTRNRFYKSFCFSKFIPSFNKAQARDVIDSFLEPPTAKINQIIEDAFNLCPDSWMIPISIKEQVFRFLTHKKRISNIKEVIWASLS